MKRVVFYLSLTVLFFLAQNSLASGGIVALENKLPHLGSDLIDIQEYDVHFTVNALNSDVQAEVLISIKAKENFKSFSLHIEKEALTVTKAVVREMAGARYKIIQGLSGKHGLSGSLLKIDLPKMIQKEETLSLQLNYTITSSSFTHNKGLMFNPDYHGSEILNARSWPYYTRYWLPSNDHPGDVATFKFSFEVPAGFMAVANGDLLKGDYRNGEGLGSNGLKKYRYHQKSPMPTYATNFAIGNFAIHSENICYNIGSSAPGPAVPCDEADQKVPLNYFSPVADARRNSFIAQIQKSAKSLIFYSNIFGNYPFAKLGFVTAPHPFNMESVNLITLVSPGAAVHEVLHQWWGNTLYFKHWGDFWISEGFTTYFTGYYDEVLTGTNSACSQLDGQLNHPESTDPMDIFDNTPYCKGAAAVHSLREHLVKLIGEPIHSKEGHAFFIKCMSSFFSEFKNRKIDTAGIVQFFRSKLIKLGNQSGYPLDQSDVGTALDTWKNQWFVNL